MCRHLSPDCKIEKIHFIRVELCLKYWVTIKLKSYSKDFNDKPKQTDHTKWTIAMLWKQIEEWFILNSLTKLHNVVILAVNVTRIVVFVSSDSRSCTMGTSSQMLQRRSSWWLSTSNTDRGNWTARRGWNSKPTWENSRRAMSRCTQVEVLAYRS